MQLRAADAVEMKPRRRKPSVRRKRPDGRRHIVRRCRELAAMFRAKLGAVADDAEVARAVQRAAELTALSEDLRQRVLRREPVAPDDLVRCERLAQSAVRALRLPARTEPKVPGVDEFLRARAAEQSRPT